MDTAFGYQVSPGIHEFRVQLFNEHFGELGERAANYLDTELWQTCEQRARNNTLIYR